MEYIVGKSFIFNSFTKKEGLALFSVRRSQKYISDTKSLIFSTVACNATPARHLWYVNYITPFPRNVSLGRLWFLAVLVTSLEARERLG